MCVQVCVQVSLGGLVLPCCLLLQVTYRVIQVSDGQLEGQTDGAAAVSLVTGFPGAGQTVTQVPAPPPPSPPKGR